MFAVVVTIDLDGHFSDELLGAVQDRDIVIEGQFVFEGCEETLHHRVVPAAALGGMLQLIVRPFSSCR